MDYALEPSAPQEFCGPSFGWSNQPAEVMAACERVASYQQGPITFAEAAPELFDQQAGSDDPVFFWDAETKVLGALLATWNQLQVGSCVGHGWGRNTQDLLLWEIACGIGDPERWPGSEVAPEIVYGGSRVEVGGGRMSGDGSVGAWAAEFSLKFGVGIRGVYGNLDLTRYSESTCRALGRSGIPADLETLVKAHPVSSVAMVTTADEGWAAVGGGKPVPICSNRGFSMSRDSRGFCQPSGTWNHCMALRGRFKEPDLGRSGVIGNSWGNYLSGNDTIRYVDVDGSVKTKQLPPGHFAAKWDVIAGMLSQRDSFAIAGLSGWKANKLSHNPLA